MLNCCVCSKQKLVVIVRLWCKRAEGKWTKMEEIYTKEHLNLSYTLTVTFLSSCQAPFSKFGPENPNYPNILKQFFYKARHYRLIWRKTIEFWELKTFDVDCDIKITKVYIASFLSMDRTKFKCFVLFC